MRSGASFLQPPLRCWWRVHGGLRHRPQQSVQILVADEDDLGEAATPLHVLHQDKGGDVHLVRVQRPLFGGDGRLTGELGVTHVTETQLFDGHYWKQKHSRLFHCGNRFDEG